MTKKSGGDDDQDYEVGYGKPPVASRFAKGKSGNPGGRPRGSGRQRKALIELLTEDVTVREGNRTRKISKFEAINARLVNAGLSGDLKACLKILSMVSPSDIRNHVEATGPQKEPITAEEAAKMYMRMIRGD
jgi:hypothetical protein